MGAWKTLPPVLTLVIVPSWAVASAGGHQKHVLRPWDEASGVLGTDAVAGAGMTHRSEHHCELFSGPWSMSEIWLEDLATSDVRDVALLH